MTLVGGYQNLQLESVKDKKDRSYNMAFKAVNDEFQTQFNSTLG